jgi:hypothetical protein
MNCVPQVAKKGGGGVWFTCVCAKNRCMQIKYLDLYKKDHENVGINMREF